MPAWSRADTAHRVARTLTSVAEKLGNLPLGSPDREVALYAAKLNLKSAGGDLTDLLDSCLRAKSMYASHPRVRNQLLGVAPLVRELRDRVDLIRVQLEEWSEQDTHSDYAPLVVALRKAAVEVAELQFAPSAYVKAAPSDDDRM